MAMSTGTSVQTNRIKKNGNCYYFCIIVHHRWLTLEEYFERHNTKEISQTSLEN